MTVISASNINRQQDPKFRPRRPPCKCKWSWWIAVVMLTVQYWAFRREPPKKMTSEQEFLYRISQAISDADAAAANRTKVVSTLGAPKNAAAIIRARHDLIEALSERTTIQKATNMESAGSQLQRSPQQQSLPFSVKGLSSKKIPDWRLTTECSVYDLHCLPRRLATGLYDRYPFPFRPSHLNRNLKDYSNTSISTTGKEHKFQWQSSLPDVSQQQQQQKREATYTYPKQASATAEQDCLQRAETLPWRQQLEILLQSRLQKEQDETDGMIAFTISDYKYAYDMIHDFWEMNDNVVGFEGGLFLVALDHDTVELACRYDYPIVAWPSALPKKNLTAGDNNNNSLKDAVVNTKLDISHELVLRNQSFFFYEMDVWFIQSPKSLIPPASEFDMMFSAHSNCANCPNIGVYAVRPNERTREYFELCQQVQSATPDTHDQLVMTQLLEWTHHYVNPEKNNSLFRFGGDWRPLPPDHLNPPAVKFPAEYGFFPPHEILAFERPQPLPMTRAIHPLSGGPLRSPHSKKIMAKELGAWYGFRGTPNEQGEIGGYYHRTGSFRRYLWLDGPSLNMLSLTNMWVEELKWTLAMLLALANSTGRIVVLPAIQEGWGNKFAWTMLDMQSVETLTDKQGNRLNVQVRETNFPNNHKAWARPNLPFRKVVRMALGDVNSNRPEEKRMYLQHGDTSLDAAEDTPVIQAWNLTLTTQGDALDAWWAIATGAASAEVDNAELLLVHNRLFWGDPKYHHSLRGRVRNDEALSRAEQEIKDIFVELRWCPSKGDQTVGWATPIWDCYGKGEPAGEPWIRDGVSN